METRADAANKKYFDKIERVTSEEIDCLPEACKTKDGVGYMCYVLRSSVTPARTYCGCTNDMVHRIRQHNGIISGGAKMTSSSRPWRIACIVTGFSGKSAALRYEYFTKMNHNRKTFERAKKAGANSIERRAAMLKAAETKMSKEERANMKFHAFDPYVSKCLDESLPPAQEASKAEKMMSVVL